MKIIVPDYYPEFRCIAGACRHSCCIGWEIDIDENTYARYRQESGPLGQRLQDNIELAGTTVSFRLDEKERCPFLTQDGLCDIILHLGEGALCQICRDHPRFRADFSDRTEIGLGLCCEEAARIILHRESPLSLITLSEDGETQSLTREEEELLSRRDTLIAIAQDRSVSMDSRINRLCIAAGAVRPEFDFARWADFYLSLEQMDPAWARLLRESVKKQPDTQVPETAQEQLLVYFLFRHMSSAADEIDFAARAAFAVLSTGMIAEIASRSGVSLSEAARLYSAEIEYSEENTEELLEELSL